MKLCERPRRIGAVREIPCGGVMRRAPGVLVCEDCGAVWVPAFPRVQDRMMHFVARDRISEEARRELVHEAVKLRGVNVGMPQGGR